MKEIREMFSRLDSWANRAQLRWPKFLRVNTQDLSLTGRILARLFKFGLVLALLGGIFWVIYWFQYRGSMPEISNPSQQHILPTIEPSATPILNTNPWQNEYWLSSAEALLLREEENVINLAYLEGGGAKYSTDSSLIFSDGWQEIKPIGMSELSVSGTATTFVLNGQKYDLNTYQPFVDSGNSEFIYMVDVNSKTWRINANSVRIVSVEKAINMLTFTINPNPNLSFTY